MKRRGSWQINFIVRALTGMGSIFLVNQWMDYRNIPVSVGLNVLSFLVSGCLVNLVLKRRKSERVYSDKNALWDYVLSVYVGVAQNVFFWFKAMDKGKSGAYNTSYKRGKAIS